MRFSKALILIILMMMGFLSCQKDEAKKIAGTWEGSWGFGADATAFPERWVINENGDLTAYDGDGDLYATGTWNADGTSFEAEYTTQILSNDYSFAGQYDETLDEITGTWGDTPSTTDGGSFEMVKQ